ncbi:MAG: hypothetical protein AB7N80_05125 [Bdellovibrionales bacterium]
MRSKSYLSWFGVLQFVLVITILTLSHMAWAITVKSQPTQIKVAAPTPPGTVPTWREGLAIGQWKEITGSNMSALIPTVSAPGNGRNTIIEAWNSLAIDPRDSTIYSVANGGHFDWAGNEVNAIKMTDNSPKWFEKKPSTPVNQIVESRSHYLDGAPTSRHSYYGMVFNKSRNRVMLLTGYWWASATSMTPAMDGYNILSNTYDPKDTFPNVPGAVQGSPGAAIIEDTATDNIYSVANYGVYRWNNGTNTWSTLLSNTPVYGYSATGAFDTQRNRFLVCGGDRAAGTAVCYLYDVAKNTLTAAQIIGLADSNLDGQGGHGMIYSAEADAYFFRRSGTSGNAVLKVAAGTLTLSQMNVQGGATAQAPINGLWKRWLYAPQLGGAFYLPTYGSNIWFVRLF